GAWCWFCSGVLKMLDDITAGLRNVLGLDTLGVLGKLGRRGRKNSTYRSTMELEDKVFSL
ncbi:MAG: hypothetical protein AB4038_07000, partial [Prochloraceae cyanobacterium]